MPQRKKKRRANFAFRESRVSVERGIKILFKLDRLLNDDNKSSKVAQRDAEVTRDKRVRWRCNGWGSIKAGLIALRTARSGYRAWGVVVGESSNGHFLNQLLG